MAANGTKLRYVVEGSGILCVVINGSRYQRVYSKDLRRHLTIPIVNDDFRLDRRTQEDPLHEAPTANTQVTFSDIFVRACRAYSLKRTSLYVFSSFQRDAFADIAAA